MTNRFITNRVIFNVNITNRFITKVSNPRDFLASLLPKSVRPSKSADSLMAAAEMKRSATEEGLKNVNSLLMSLVGRLDI